MRQFLLSSLFVVVSFSFFGCSAISEAGQSIVEVPTLEKQANRVAIGMVIVRENNLMARKMPISADAKWPKKITAPLTQEEKHQIKKLLLNDPYFATVNYTEPLQRNMLGSGSIMNQFGGLGQIAASMLNQTITPLMYRAFYKIIIFYGENPKNWPDIFDFDRSKGSFEEFYNGKLVEIEALHGDIYPTITDALIALVPINLQKDLELAKDDMMRAYAVVLDLKSQLAEIETKLKANEAANVATTRELQLDPILSQDFHLSYSQKEELQERKSVLKEQISQAEAIADEKEKIYFTLLDQASIALQSDINLDDKNYIKLAQNINLVANDIQTSANEVYSLFTIASTKILSDGIIQNFPKELESLALAKAAIPLQLQDKYNQRLKRLVKNTLYILPNIFMGIYYAHKQSVVAQKYVDFTNIILEAYNVKLEQESAKNAPTHEEIEKIQGEK